MKYFAELFDKNRAAVVIRVNENLSCYRFDWGSEQWVYDPGLFLKMHGVGGDGYDWVEVTKAQAGALIRSRLKEIREKS